MVMTTAEFRDTVSPVLNTCFKGIYNKHAPEWKTLFKSETALKRKFEEEYVMYGLGTAKIKGEGAGVSYDKGGISYRVRFEPLVYAIAFSITEELVEDGEHLNMGKLYAEHAARGILEAEEIVHADIFNRAQDANYLGGDGVPLLSTAHPLATGGTFSNRLTNAVQLSEASLEDLLIKVRTAVDERGKFISLKPQRLIVSPHNEYEATRILQSMNRSGTANNDVNAIRALGKLPANPFLLTRLTKTEGYYIQTDAPRGLIHKDRRPLKSAIEGEFETGNLRQKWHHRYVANWVDPRCLYGSEGQ